MSPPGPAMRRPAPCCKSGACSPGLPDDKAAQPGQTRLARQQQTVRQDRKASFETPKLRGFVGRNGQEACYGLISVSHPNEMELWTTEKKWEGQGRAKVGILSPVCSGWSPFPQRIGQRPTEGTYWPRSHTM